VRVSANQHINAFVEAFDDFGGRRLRCGVRASVPSQASAVKLPVGDMKEGWRRDGTHSEAGKLFDVLTISFRFNDLPIETEQVPRNPKISRTDDVGGF
jgi:hypothetical protein